MELRWVLSVAGASELEVGRAGAQKVETQRSRASMSCGDAAGKQLRGGENARTARHGLRPRGDGSS